MAVVGDLDLDETLGAAARSAGRAQRGACLRSGFPPAALAELLRGELEAGIVGEAGLLRQARPAQSLDRMAAEDVAPEQLLTIDIAGRAGEALAGQPRLFARCRCAGALNWRRGAGRCAGAAQSACSTMPRRPGAAIRRRFR
jgi:ATP-dependent helicase/nuclease subunit B